MFKILRKKYHNTEYQLAIIQTSIYSKNGESSQLIAIRSYRGEYPSIIPLIEKEVHEDFAGFDIVGITVKSSISNIGVPINDIDTKLFWDEQINCFEFDYQLSPHQLCLNRTFYGIMKSLHGKRRLESSLSLYTLKRTDPNVFQDRCKISLFNVGRQTALEVNNEVMNGARQYFHRLSKIEPEFIVYHTNID